MLFYFNTIFSQGNKNFIFPKTNALKEKKCGYFLNVLTSKPKEVNFRIIREGTKLFFETNDKQWLVSLFKNSGDGIAIDIVSKSQYSCNKTNKNSQLKGVVLKAIYAKQFLRKLKLSKENRFKTFVGNVPNNLKDDELEFNILFLSNQTLCSYNSLYNLQSYPWELLDMGAYLDSLVFKDKKITNIEEQVITKYKTLKFVIPFKKNKSEYLPEDIKPLYDSLKLTDFTIKKINIKAYSSIEGSLNKNIKLQEKRANSIIRSLQTFQKPDIEIKISSSENWVEFLKDISKTKYKGFKNFTKPEIKVKVRGVVSENLEFILKNHRKAVIILHLEKKDKYKKMSLPTLISTFNKYVKEEKVKEASMIQNSIFIKIKEEANPDILKELRVPKQIKFIPLLNKKSMYFYLLNLSYAKISFDKLKELEKLDPGNKKIKYNLVVLKFIIWKNNWESIKGEAFKKEINNLKKLGINQFLIDRMMVNFHIVKAEKDMRARNYTQKDESVEFIIDTYENFKLSNYDYLSLAQFLTYYSNIDDATDLLEEKVMDITVDEDLLFYYLNLTLTKKYYTESQDYRTIMLNAIGMNKNRFCKLFNSSLKGGVTFQLLEDTYLQSAYCENCTKN